MQFNEIVRLINEETDKTEKNEKLYKLNKIILIIVSETKRVTKQ